MRIFDLDRIDAICVQFKTSMTRRPFPNKGMKAWLTDIVKDEERYELYFDFSDFEEENDKYFKYSDDKANYYKPKYSVYFGDIEWTEEKLEENINKYLKNLSGRFEKSYNKDNVDNIDTDLLEYCEKYNHLKEDEYDIRITFEIVNRS